MELESMGLEFIPVPILRPLDIRRADDWLCLELIGNVVLPYVWATNPLGIVVRKAHADRARRAVAEAVRYAVQN